MGISSRVFLTWCLPCARSEKVLPGVEEAVKMMHTGDVWELAVPGKLGFGEKGRSASPGKPRIPNNAVRLRGPGGWWVALEGGAGGREGVCVWSSTQPDAARASGDEPPVAPQDLVFVVELSAVPGKDEEMIDILEEEKAAEKAAEKPSPAPAPEV